MSGLPDDAIARAKAIAARLTASLGPEGGGGGTKRRFGEGDSDVPRKREKVYIPKDNTEFNFFSLLIGPRGSTQKRLQEHTGARINIRGTGSEGGKTEDAPDGEPQEDMHVLIEGTDEQVAAAKKEVEKILFDPAEAMRLKAAQLRNLAEIKGGYQPGVGVAGGAGADGDGHYGPGRPKPGLGFGAEPETGEMKIPSSMVSKETEPGEQTRVEKVGMIIGRSGAVIKEIQHRTGTRIQVPTTAEPGSNPPIRAVTIMGPGDGPERARYEIEMKLMNEGCRDAQGNYIPYQPSPAFMVPVGPNGVPGATPPPPPPQASPYFQAPPGYPPQQPPPGYPPTGYPPQPQQHQPDPYAAYYQQQQQQQQPPPQHQQHTAYPPQPNGGAGAPPPSQQQQPAATPAPAPAPATNGAAGTSAAGDAASNASGAAAGITLPSPAEAAAAIAALSKTA
eukprot:evm.model.NODE_2982_length_36456_cov_21.122120.1